MLHFKDTNMQLEILQTRHTEAYTLTKEKKGKNIYIVAPKVHVLNFG